MTTNITPELRERSLAMLAGEGNLALFSIFLGGKPTAAIVAVDQVEGGGDFTIVPLAVMVTPDIAEMIEDHEGAKPQEGATA